MSNEQSNNTQSQTRSLDIPGAASFQQRSAQTASSPVRPHGGSAYSSPAQNPMGSDEDNRRLVISQGITISGEIAACDHLVIEGTVEAALKGARVLEVTETGVFYGTVEIEEAVIAGQFEGDITVNGRLSISGTGTVMGSISYKELEVEAGATIDGKITPLSAKASGAKTAPKKAPVKKSGPRNDNAGKTELPFEANAAAEG